MPKIFADGEAQDYDRLRKVLSLHHSRLIEVSARVSITFVRAFDKDDEPIPSLKFAGANAVALVKLVSPERKLRIPFDAEIKIDGYLWDELTELSKDALIDHELNHLQVKTDANGVPILDDQNNAKLKLVPDDFVLTGFFNVIRHYGENANEYQSVSRITESVSQALESAAQVFTEIVRGETHEAVEAAA